MNQPTPDKRLTIRFTQEEYALLKLKAGDQPLSRFVREVVLAKASIIRKSRKSAPIKDHIALAQVLAILGKSDVFSGLSSLKQASDLGLIDLDDKEIASVQSACNDLAIIKSLIMDALGINEQ